MQNFQEFFSDLEAESLKEGLNSGNQEAVNSTFAAALERFKSKEVAPLAEKASFLESQMTELEKKAHARFLDEQLRRPISKALGIKPKELENLTAQEILAKALELSKNDSTSAEIEKRYNEAIEKNEELIAKLANKEQEFQEKWSAKEREFSEKSILLHWFSESAGLFSEAWSYSDGLDIVSKELSSQGKFLRVENGEVVVKDANGKPVFGLHNKILSAKDVLNESRKLKAMQKGIEPQKAIFEPIKEEEKNKTFNPKEEMAKIMESRKTSK